MSAPAPAPPRCECGYRPPSWAFLGLHRVWAHRQDARTTGRQLAAQARQIAEARP